MSGGTGEWCTAALVGRDLLLTAAHCVTSQTTGQILTGSKIAEFGDATGSPYGPVQTWNCATVVQVNQDFDTALLRCAPNAEGKVPGESWEILPVRRTQPPNGVFLYLPSVNCLSTDFCSQAPPDDQRILLSPGGLQQTTSRFEKCELNDNEEDWDDGQFDREGMSYNCDTAPGSSGAPVFWRDQKQIVAVNSFGNTTTDLNYGGAAWKFLEQNDARLPVNWIFDQAEKRPNLLWTRPSDGMATLYELNDGDGFVSQKALAAKPGYLARAYSRRNSVGAVKILWGSAAGGTARIQYLTVADNPSTSPDRQFGPYASHWMPIDYERISDSESRLLWTKTDDGAANLWKLDGGDNLVSEKQYPARGAGWFARAYARPGTGRLLWSHHASDGWNTAEIWTLDGTDNYVSHVTIGPYYQWIPTAYEVAPGSTRRLIWTRLSDGKVAIWKLNSLDQYLGQVDYGPFGGWAGEDYCAN